MLDLRIALVVKHFLWVDEHLQRRSGWRRNICCGNADIGVGITGIAGPGGGSEEKPVGLVYVAVTDGQKQEVVQRRFPGDRERIRRWASQLALDMVRRLLM